MMKYTGEEAGAGAAAGDGGKILSGPWFWHCHKTMAYSCRAEIKKIQILGAFGGQMKGGKTP